MTRRISDNHRANSVHPKALANTVKHFAFAHCAESNLYGIVDAQIVGVESELLAGIELVP
jgi:hypothetical protein